MSFAVRCERTAFEYCGNSLNSFFAQRRNILRPDHYQLLAEILRFNRSAVSLVEESPEATLGELVVAAKFSDRFVDRYLVPIGASVWSTDPKRMLEFPARFLVRFFDRHGMLEHQEQPDWRVVRGGSARYVDALKRPFHSKIRLSTAVRAVRRNEEDVSVLTQQGGEERFDQVVLDQRCACAGSSAVHDV